MSPTHKSRGSTLKPDKVMQLFRPGPAKSSHNSILRGVFHFGKFYTPKFTSNSSIKSRRFEDGYHSIINFKKNQAEQEGNAQGVIVKHKKTHQNDVIEHNAANEVETELYNMQLLQSALEVGHKLTCNKK